MSEPTTMGVPDHLGEGGAHLAPSGVSGTPGLKEVLLTQFATIHPPVANATAMQAILEKDRANAMVVFKTDTAKWWYYSAASTASAGATVIVPDDDDGTGRWLLASDSDLATLALTTTGNGASLIGVEDAATRITATTVEGALAEVFAIIGPSITKLQLVTGTFVSGLCTVTVGAGQTVTASTRAIPFMQAVITGSTNVGTLTHMFASNVAGGSGVGQVLFRVLGSDGATDVDAAGAFAALLIN